MKLTLLGFLLLPCFALAERPPLEAPYTQAPAKRSDYVRKPIEKPKSIDEDTGDYYYSDDTQPDAIYYKVEDLPPIKGAFYLRFGSIGPFDIKSDNSNNTYKDVYTKSSSLVVYLEYERQLGHLLGKWSVKMGSGIATEDGSGRFSNPAVSPLRSPNEKYTFFVMPNTVALSYKLNFSDKQWITPYVDAGGGYFTFIEYRNDGDHTAYGGAPVLSGAGGLLLSFNMLDKNSASMLYADYAINHMWLDLQFRRIQGLDDTKDFSSNMVTAGFGFAF